MLVLAGAAASAGAEADPSDRRTVASLGDQISLEAAREFWAFQPIADASLPVVKDTSWPQVPLDCFVFAGLEARGLEPAAPADKLTLLRRANFDLIGLPPTPEEIEVFLADRSPGAFAKLIDRLLASPHYGERWGRHWLDVARYADSNGMDENLAYGNAWRYRDYVVRALNQDKPFDQFVIEQLAGDLIPVADDPAETNQRLVATSYLALGPKLLAEKDPVKMEMDILDEQIDTLGRSLLGLTLGCARCHAHKFDPISTEDYYGLVGIFKSTSVMENFIKLASWQENLLPTPEYLELKKAHDEKVAPLKVSLQQLVRQANARLIAKRDADFQLPKDSDVLASLYPEETREELKRVRDELKQLKKEQPPAMTSMGATEREATDVRVHLGGSHMRLGEVVPRRFPVVLAGRYQSAFNPDRSGRLRLAKWLMDPQSAAGALTSRVFVNRMWRWHFGQGLVRTTDNFGQLGDRPSHPRLLDWAARQLIQHGWSLKAMHRQIMLSATYQMSSQVWNPRAEQMDPGNRLHWRMNMRRLEAEPLRDALLFVSGRLDRTMGGSLLQTENRDWVTRFESIDPNNYDIPRRSVYLPVVRNALHDVFQIFDYQNASLLSGDRPTTSVAPQALFMMNSQFALDCADCLAGELLARHPSVDDGARIQKLYFTVFGRPPSARELDQARLYIARLEEGLSVMGTDVGVRRQQAWQLLCQVMLASNQFVYVR